MIEKARNILKTVFGYDRFISLQQSVIENVLGGGESSEFVASFNRENLLIRVVPNEHPFRQTVNFLRKFPNESGIVYCMTRTQVDGFCAAPVDDPAPHQTVSIAEPYEGFCYKLAAAVVLSEASPEAMKMLPNNGINYDLLK